MGEIIQRRAEDSNIPIGGTARAGKMVLEKLGGKGTRAAAPVLMKSQLVNLANTVTGEMMNMCAEASALFIGVCVLCAAQARHTVTR